MQLSMSSLSRLGGLAAVTAVLVAFAISVAEARPGGGRSFGSRGDRTWSQPPATNTTPGMTKPMDRSMAQPNKANPAAAPATAGAATQAAKPNMMRNLLLGGLIGAGLASIFGTGALASILGFALQMALIVGIVMLIMAFFRSRQSPQPAMASASGARSQQPNAQAYRQSASSLGGDNSSLLNISGDDYNAFERLLDEVQTAYGRNDVKALEKRLTPEMLSYFAEELSENAKKGLRNEVSSAKLLQGDLSEAWRDSSGEYATVAMRYSLLDAMVETASGRVVSGSRSEPSEATEVWTFWRPRNGNASQWELSAIQQTS